MATVSKTFVEDLNPDYKATWTISANASDFTVSGSTFSPPIPNVNARYVYSSKNYAKASVYGYSKITGPGGQYTSSGAHWYRGTYTGSTAVASTSGTTYALSKTETYTNTANTSTYWNSNNPTIRTLALSFEVYSMELGSFKGSEDLGNQPNYYRLYNTVNFGTVCYATLDAPPTFTASALSKDTDGYWAGATTVSTRISSASAKYGGNITSSSLTIGDQTVSGSGNGTLSIALANAGTFTPQVSVTDSRGQVTTKSLDAITVNPYLVPSVSFDVYRTNASGVKDDEGHCGLIIGQMTYTDALANLAEPSVSIDGTPIEDVVGATVTWYTGYSASTGVDATTEIDGTNITWADVASGSTVYALIDCDYDITGKFSEGLSYQIGIVANDSIDGHSTPIIQTLSTAFYTIDFQAGGKEIAFGAPANDDVTNYEEGLFKCAMSFRLKDHLMWIGTRSEYDDAVDDGKMPEHSIVILTDEDADYVVEEGTSGIWTYRKWSSGKVDCWGSASSSSLTWYAYPTGLYYNSPALTVTYPFAIYSPCISATVTYCGGNIGWALATHASDTTTNVSIIRNGNSGQVIVDIAVHGRWK